MLLLESLKGNERESQRCLGPVFNFKLGCLVIMHGLLTLVQTYRLGPGAYPLKLFSSKFTHSFMRGYTISLINRYFLSCNEMVQFIIRLTPGFNLIKLFCHYFSYTFCKPDHGLNVTTIFIFNDKIYILKCVSKFIPKSFMKLTPETIFIL